MSERILGALRKNVLYKSTYTLRILYYQGRLHKGGMVRDEPWRKVGGGIFC